MIEQTRPRYGAFFDVDETLIAVKSMFRFLAHYLAERGEPPTTYQRLADELRHLAAAGAPREEINRRYYRLYASESTERLTCVGRRWFDWEMSRSDLFVPATLEALTRHARADVWIGLVSGSFFACLDPVAAHVGAHAAAGTQLVIRRGVLTGEVHRPVIGAAKADTVRDLARRHRLSLPDSYAYGDHATDLPMLQTVGHPVVVGTDPVLRAHATRHRWSVLPDAATPTAVQPSP